LTSSLAVVGVQRPAAEHVPPAPENDADDAAYFAAAYGLIPDDWQRHVLEAWLGHDDGQLTSARCGLAVPRQNGKNALIEIIELFKMVAQSRRVLHTAHEVKTARKAFARLKYFFGDKADDPAAQFPELNNLVKEVRNTNGQEAIVLRNGGSVEFIARSKSSGRGFSVDDLIMDEAQELSEDALAALRPTISASPNPQIIFTGTPPGPTAVGEVFTRQRMNGLSGKDDRLCWMEWRAHNADDMDSRPP
jgi:phage terminase large subunit-like protein